jgi:hypothetical protein
MLALIDLRRLRPFRCMGKQASRSPPKIGEEFVEPSGVASRLLLPTPFSVREGILERMTEMFMIEHVRNCIHRESIELKYADIAGETDFLRPANRKLANDGFGAKKAPTGACRRIRSPKSFGPEAANSPGKAASRIARCRRCSARRLAPVAVVGGGALHPRHPRPSKWKEHHEVFDARIAATVSSPRSCARSMPRISAPSAPESGRMSSVLAFIGNMEISSDNQSIFSPSALTTGVQRATWAARDCRNFSEFESRTGIPALGTIADTGGVRKEKVDEVHPRAASDEWHRHGAGAEQDLSGLRNLAGIFIVGWGPQAEQQAAGQSLAAGGTRAVFAPPARTGDSVVPRVVIGLRSD